MMTDDALSCNCCAIRCDMGGCAYRLTNHGSLHETGMRHGAYSPQHIHSPSLLSIIRAGPSTGGDDEHNMMNTTVDDTSREERTQALVKASDGIASAANACRDSLARCLDIESLRSEWAEHRLADFNLWDLSVGASCEPSKTSSLEKRLKNKEHIRDAIMGLLRALKMAIDHCKNLGNPELTGSVASVLD